MSNGAGDDHVGGQEPWLDLADALLQRAAVVLRGDPPDHLAGLRVLDEEAERILDELTAGLQPPLAWADVDPLVTAARDRLDAALADDADAFAALVAAAGLSRVEAEVLALAAAVELDPRRQRLVAYLHDDVTRRRPSLHLLLAVLGREAALAAGHDGRLSRAGMLALRGDGPWESHEVVVPAQVVWHLLGDASLDPDLPSDVLVVLGVGREHAGGGRPVVVVAGHDRTRRLQAALAEVTADAFLVLPAPGSAAGWAALVRTATLHGLGVVVEAGESLPADGRWWIERADHLAWCISSRLDIPVLELPNRPWRHVEAASPLVSADEVRAVLDHDLPSGHRIQAEQLRQLELLVPAVDGDVGAAIRRLTAAALEQQARRVRPRYQLDDLVLPPKQAAQLTELIARYRNRDKVHGEWGVPAVPSAGLVALFTGPSGTGKTTAAEIVAGALGLDLFVLDVASVMSKYIGETEKNLERVFDAAEAGNLVLLFDEADALFGKRTEVSDARDRYANVEVSYLLQKLETFDGLLVLTTNLQGNIDAAFQRRLHATISFSLPDAAERERIWRRWLATGAPIGDVDAAELANMLEVSGGVIRNACVTAAFLAAEAGTAVEMPLLVRALSAELEKAGRLCTEEQFGRWWPYVAQSLLSEN